MGALDAAMDAKLAAAAKAAQSATKTAEEKQAAIDAATAATVAAGGKSTDPANRLPGETATQANARITAGYKAQVKPELTQEGAAAGATIEFVRTGAGGVGTYKEVFPIGGGITPTSTATTTAVTPQVGTGIYQMLNGILYFDGKPFTGTWNGQN